MTTYKYKGEPSDFYTCGFYVANNQHCIINNHCVVCLIAAYAADRENVPPPTPLERKE